MDAGCERAGDEPLDQPDRAGLGQSERRAKLLDAALRVGGDGHEGRRGSPGLADDRLRGGIESAGPLERDGAEEVGEASVPGIAPPRRGVAATGFRIPVLGMHYSCMLSPGRWGRQDPSGRRRSNQGVSPSSAS